MCVTLLEIQERMQLHGRQPLWFLDVPHHLRPGRGRGDPARPGRSRWRRDLLDQGFQPKKHGQSFIYRAAPGGEPEAVTPDDASAFSVRSRVHEYGGGAFAVQDGTVYFSNFADQRLYSPGAGQSPRPITPAAAPANALRYADGVIDRHRGRLICVHEDHARSGQAVNTLASLDLSGAHHQGRAPEILVAGNDFYSTPRLSPDGTRLAWLTWNHPDMPWVAAEAMGRRGPGRRHGGEGAPDRREDRTNRCSSRNGRPTAISGFVSDRGSGWWNLYRKCRRREEPMAPMDAEFGQGAVEFRDVDLRVQIGATHRLLLRSRWRLAARQLDTRTRRFDPISLPFTSLSQLRAGPGRAVFLGGSPSEATALVELDLGTGAHRVIRRSAVLGDELRPYISVAQPVSFPTAGGETAHALYYPPLSLVSPRRLERKRPCWSGVTAGRPRRPRARCRWWCSTGLAAASACST